MHRINNIGSVLQLYLSSYVVRSAFLATDTLIVHLVCLSFVFWLFFRQFSECIFLSLTEPCRPVDALRITSWRMLLVNDENEP